MNNQIVRDRGKLVAYLQRRIRRYPKYENLGPGRDEDPVALLTVGHYAAQTGYVAVVFDTRRNGRRGWRDDPRHHRGASRPRRFHVAPASPEAFFVVEEFDGAWRWPPYEERRRRG